MGQQFELTFTGIFIKLRRGMQNKRSGKLASVAILLRDNARSHTAVKTKKKIQDFRWKLFDYCTIPTLYLAIIFSSFGGQRFETDQEFEKAVFNWFKFQVASFYTKGSKNDTSL